MEERRPAGRRSSFPTQREGSRATGGVLGHKSQLILTGFNTVLLIPSSLQQSRTVCIFRTCPISTCFIDLVSLFRLIHFPPTETRL